AYLATQQYHLTHKAEADAFWAQEKACYQGGNDITPLLTQAVNLSQIKTVTHPNDEVLTLQGGAYEQLKAMCQQQGVTLNATVQFAWHKLLHIYTGDEQTLVGSTVSGRDVPVDGIGASVGLYINTLPLRVQWEQTASIASILQNIQRSIALLNSYSAMPLARLQTDGRRLFHSLFVFENYPAPEQNPNTAGIEGAVSFRQAVEKVDYPLSVMAHEQGDSLV
ncbi:condensation domain-containing protein, partial [Xenorhabdus vietnamensis]|uniref:condensation domain-containing protein n=1 Tax=Xenorhabdus vietnamensis TaxID=351656 RepID=UPI001FCA03D7